MGKELSSALISRLGVGFAFLSVGVYFLVSWVFLFCFFVVVLGFCHWNKHTITEVYYNLQRISSKTRKYSLLKQCNYVAEVSTLVVHMNKCSPCVLEC